MPALLHRTQTCTPRRYRSLPNQPFGFKLKDLQQAEVALQTEYEHLNHQRTFASTSSIRALLHQSNFLENLNEKYCKGFTPVIGRNEKSTPPYVYWLKVVQVIRTRNASVKPR